MSIQNTTYFSEDKERILFIDTEEPINAGGPLQENSKRSKFNQVFLEYLVCV